MPRRPREKGVDQPLQDKVPKPKGRPEPLLSKVAHDVGVSPQQVKAAARLLDEGNTLPFIARYRKEAIGSMDETQLRSVAAKLASLDSLEEQRSSVLNKLQKLGVLSESLKAQVQQAETPQRLEDIYLPYRPKRATKASAARDKGFEPLADIILRGGREKLGGPVVQLREIARKFVRQPEVTSIDHALAGAQDIIAERAAELPAAREKARGDLQQYGVLVSRLSPAAKQAKQGEGKVAKAGKSSDRGKGGKAGGSKAAAPAQADAGAYALYHEFSCPVRNLRPHQVLALNRGEAQGVLSVSLQWRQQPVEALCLRLLLEQGGGGQTPTYIKTVQEAVESGVKRLLKPAMEREARSQLTEVAAQHAVQTFARNLHNLLLQPPMPGLVVLGVDPAFRTGCKLAVCDPTGKVLATGVVYPHAPAPKAQQQQAASQLVDMVRKHRVQAVSIGNGTASGETQRFVADALAAAGLSKQAGWCVVSEAGASVYSASELAAKELPGMDVSLRGAASIARRLQDPLSELVKVPPESLGVGAYQHDLKAATLAAQLGVVVESAVNAVGVDLNAASPALLSWVAGLSKATAAAIVAWRDAQGVFHGRQQLLEVKSLGPRTFQQCAGFLRVRGGATVLDCTAVHPESYAAAEALVREACGGVGQQGPPQKKRKTMVDAATGAVRGAEPSTLSVNKQLSAAMLQQARPALATLLGRPLVTSAGGGGPAGAALQVGAPAAGPGSKQLPPQQQQQQRQGGGVAGGGGGGGGSWVTGESVGQLAARLWVGRPTLEDIVESLLAPDRDLRGQSGLAALQFKQALGIEELAPGMVLSGVVRNVVDFGAFVDVNARQV